MSFDVDDFLTMPRLSGLLASPRGRLVVHSALPDRDAAKFVTGIVEIDPAGSARPLTVPRAGLAAVGCTPEGDLLLLDRRPDPSDNDAVANDAVAALWQLPATGGEAGFVAATPSGVDAVRVARDAGTTVLLSEVFPGASSLTDDRTKADTRKKADTSALLFEGFPFRHWDRNLGPRAPRLFVVEADGGVHDLTGDVGQALREAAWDITPDGSTILTSWETPAGRADVDRDLVAIDVKTSRRRILLREPDVLTDAVACSPDGRYAAVIRTVLHTTPWDVQLWLVPLDGRPPRRLAASLDLWPDSPVWTPDSSAVLFTADQHGRKPVWRVNIAVPDAEPVRLSHAGAFSDIQPAPDGTTVYALRTTMAQPPEVVALDLAQPDQEPYVVYAATSPDLPGQVEEVHTTAEDGTPLRGWLVLPKDSTGPAPLVLMVHGGPFASWNSWQWRWQPQVFAGRGYATLCPDPALSTGYGRHMLQRAWTHWGNVPYSDLIALTNSALQRPDLDADRTAVAGGSYGGYMANWIIGHTDGFRCAVSHAGVWDEVSMRNTSDEMLVSDRLWGDPNESRELYRDISPSTYVDKITTPTLVVHGEHDYRVPVSEGLAVYANLQRRGVRSALLYLPDENHWVLKPGNIRIWYSTVLAWLDHHVLGKPWSPPEIL